MLKWVDKLPLEVAQWIPEEYFGYGQVPSARVSTLEKGRVYTLKYKYKWGFLLDDYTNFLKKCLSDIAHVITIAETGIALWSDHYITLIPKKTVSLAEMTDAIYQCFLKFKKQVPPYIIVMTPHFKEIYAGNFVEAKKEETKASVLPGWAKELALIGGLTIIGAVAIRSLMEKI